MSNLTGDEYTETRIIEIVKEHVHHERVARKGWPIEHLWLIDENEKIIKAALPLYDELLEQLKVTGDPHYNPKATERMLKKRTMDLQKKSWPKLHRTFNENYGRFGWLPLESGGPYVRRFCYTKLNKLGGYHAEMVLRH